VKEWLRKYQITIINASVTILLIAVIVIVLLVRTTVLYRQNAEKNLVNQAGIAAMEIQAQYLPYFNIVRTLSQIMGGFQSVDINQRRVLFNNIMQGVLDPNPDIISVYTVWRPQALDGRDARFANTPGTDRTGRYMAGFVRKQDRFELRAFGEHAALLDPGSELEQGESVSVPELRTFDNGAVYAVDIRAPVMSGGVVVGLVGLTINMDHVQIMAQSLRPYKTGQLILCSSDGTIAAHTNTEMRGINFMDAGFHRALDSENRKSGQAERNREVEFVFNSLRGAGPPVLRTKKLLVASYPCRMGNTASPWVVVTTVPLETIMAPLRGLIRFSIIFIIVAGELAAIVIYLTSNSLTQHALAIQHDLERATTMQDNLKYGLFLLDQNMIIQGAYSKALEKILSVADLQGKAFFDVFSSFKPQERKGITTYFEMLFKRSFDTKMLDTLNPINEFSHFSAEAGGVKSLRSTFSLVEWKRDELYILGTLEDISAEKELAKQLAEAEDIREKEMRALFQVIQLNPRVLGDFIEDTEYEFDRINELLKGRGNLAHEVAARLYQSVHAIKSNALLLNLENFSSRMHKLETSIKYIQEQYDQDIPVEEFLNIVFDLDNVMKETDWLKAIITKIENFKSSAGPDENQNRYILEETLSQACEKAQTALGKKAQIVFDTIDTDALTQGPRRTIKEVLTQLVRNAVYHGIEAPAERRALGKEAAGCIRLSIACAEKLITITLSDDGRGLDFNQIRQKAQNLKLFRNPAEAADKNRLLQILFSPGFSTAGKVDLHAGRGVGLSLVRDRIKELNGSVSVRTTSGKGTTFIITIPQTAAPDR
jgi:two-component system chemotaxis sensor kinase CheA